MMKPITLILAVATLGMSPARSETMRSDYFACRTEELFERGERMVDSKDFEALQRFLVDAIALEQCAWIKAGTKVFWEAAGSKFYYVKIRPQGLPMSLVTRSTLIVD